MSNSPAAASAPRDLLVGRTLGDFVLHEKIGEGGFGSVYRAEQPMLEREAVVKVLRSNIQADPSIVQGFLREARVASQINHPFATHIYAFGAESDGLMWIAMELVRGTTLDTLLETQGPLPLRRFIGLFDRLCEVMQTAHERGIVHCDLKPANVMILARSGRLLPKLLDLGIAKLRATVPAAPSPEAPVAPVGSPQYMAPEQWTSPDQIDARTDIYSLGLIAYEALTGQRLIDGPTMVAIARAHATKQLPPLPPGLPTDLHPVIARALAKAPDDRYAAATEFAAAVRHTSGSDSEPEELPALEDTLRETVLVQAPQPLADAVTLLEAARDLEQLRSAVYETSRALVHYLGVLALACRVRIGPGEAVDMPAVTELLRKLRRDRLADAEWLALARDLCRAFRNRADVYPIPELIHFFYQTDGGASPHQARLERLLADTARGVKLDLQMAATLVSELDVVLRASHFLSEYLLAIPAGERLELCMGARRRRRASMALKDRALGADEAVLVDREGSLMLSLAPFVQVLSPTPGAADEIFLFDGNGRHGARLLARPAGFERHDAELWGASKGLFDTTEESAIRIADEKSPYRGLATFGKEDADLFFGREREAEAFANRLRMQSLIAIVGPSGAGKSSFVQAGVIPSLPGDWQAIVMRPGVSPLAALASRLSAEGMSANNLRDELLHTPEALGNLLCRVSRERERRILLLVDQFEELVTLCQSEDERVLFAAALVAAAGNVDGPIRVVLTLRDDFLMRVQQVAPLRGRLAQGLELLGTPEPADLRRILVEPAQRRGYEFDDPTLPDRMVETVINQAGALALLSFAASKLWELRDRQFKRLTNKAYESLGGVGGALAQHAERSLGEMAEGDRGLVREAFRHLVTAEGTRAALSRSEMSQVLGGGQPAERVLEQLIGARLLVAQDAGDGDTRIEVIHETLLSSWPRLVKWQREDAESARMRDQIRAAARQWHERGRPKGMLWRAETLTEYRVWRARYQGALTEIEAAFATASLRDEARGRRIRRVLAMGAFVTLCVGLLILLRANHRAQVKTARLYQEQGTRAVLAQDPMRGLVFLQQAYREGTRGKALEFLMGRSFDMLGGQLAVLRHRDQVNKATFSPDGKWIVSASEDGTAILWQAKTGRRVHILQHDKGVWTVSFSADSRLVVTGSWDTTAKLWDVATGQCRHTFQHSSRVMAVDFSPDGKRLVTGTGDGIVKVWDMLSGRELLSLKHDRTVWSAAFSPDGTRILTGSWDKTARLWDARNGALLATLEGHRDSVWSVAFSPDGARMATASWDGTVRIWDGKTGRCLLTLDSHPAPVASGNVRYESVAFSPDGSRVLTVAEDSDAHVWDSGSGRHIFTATHGRSFVMAVAFSPDGKHFAVGTADGVTKLWDAKAGTLLWTFTGHLDSINWVAFNLDGTRLVTASADGTARVWDTSRRDSLLALSGHNDTVGMAAFSPDGKHIASAGEDQTLKVWDAKNGKLVSLLEGPPAHLQSPIRHKFVAFSPDGRRLLTATDDFATVWEIESRKAVLTLRGHVGPIWFGSYSPDGKRIITAGEDKLARLWDAETGQMLGSFSGHTGRLWSALFNPDGTRVVTASFDKTAKVWDTVTQREILSLSGHAVGVEFAAFSPDGRRIVTASDDSTAKIWEAATGKSTASLEGHVVALSFAMFQPPDGELVVTASWDNTWRIWDAKAGTMLSSVAIGAGVNSATFSPDGRRVVTAGQDGSVKVWDVEGATMSPQSIERYIECWTPLRIGGAGQLVRAKPNEALCRDEIPKLGASSDD